MAKDKFNYIFNSYANAGGHGYGSFPKVVKPFWTANGSNNFGGQPKIIPPVKQVCEGLFGEEWKDCLRKRGNLNINGHVAPDGDDSNCSVWCSTGVLDTYCCQYQRPRK